MGARYSLQCQLAGRGTDAERHLPSAAFSGLVVFETVLQFPMPHSIFFHGDMQSMAAMINRLGGPASHRIACTLQRRLSSIGESEGTGQRARCFRNNPVIAPAFATPRPTVETFADDRHSPNESFRLLLASRAKQLFV
jgi:hypothetical protein